MCIEFVKPYEKNIDRSFRFFFFSSSLFIFRCNKNHEVASYASLCMPISANKNDRHEEGIHNQKQRMAYNFKMSNKKKIQIDGKETFSLHFFWFIFHLSFQHHIISILIIHFESAVECESFCLYTSFSMFQKLS